ncbi:hypothetical protein CDL15_Pgr000803 [Punica granatum]|uniref:Uncharacterized protein n=1 Tax=Punica granatum TaxID=22663 RepID=A0A218W542_PUNGR|nr:hypothetical protein CDL15_Pgr000803 [Punica granatum]
MIKLVLAFSLLAFASSLCFISNFSSLRAIFKAINDTKPAVFVHKPTREQSLRESLKKEDVLLFSQGLINFQFIVRKTAVAFVVLSRLNPTVITMAN